MAVVQISRIQVRRGKANAGTGFPQLASGEFGWAIDSQELYIGNGSVAEGSPGVGNTKILTANDISGQTNLLALIQYVYRAKDTTIITGTDANNPISRILQDRFDDRVSTKEFGAIGDGTTDDTVALQRAINQLFLNSSTKASADTAAGVSARVVLEIPAGIYRITSTLYVPSYATLRGDGADKTIFYFDPAISYTGPAIQFVNDASTIGNPNSIANTQSTTQPRGIYITGLSVHSPSGKNTCLQLDSVRDSLFENLNLKGDWANVYNSACVGVAMNATTTLVSCEHNIFRNIKFTGFSYAVYAKYDVRNNVFEDCYVTDARQGFMLGQNANGSTTGQVYGPRETAIIGCKFYNIKWHAVYVDRGTGNTTRDCKFTNVGCNGAGNTGAEYPQVYYKTFGNSSQNDYSDRPADLSISNLAVPYVPELGGHGSYTSYGTQQITLGQITSPVLAFRLPVSTDQYGGPIGSISYNINYFYKSTSNSFTRAGVITVSADIDNKKIQISDEYNFAGNDVSNTTALILDFSTYFLDQDGVQYTGAYGQTPSSIAINYSNNLSGDAGYFNYSYTASM
jgi:hypothetical protein